MTDDNVNVSPLTANFVPVRTVLTGHFYLAVCETITVNVKVGPKCISRPAEIRNPKSGNRPGFRNSDIRFPEFHIGFPENQIHISNIITWISGIPNSCLECWNSNKCISGIPKWNSGKPTLNSGMPSGKMRSKSSNRKLEIWKTEWIEFWPVFF